MAEQLIKIAASRQLLKRTSDCGDGSFANFAVVLRLPKQMTNCMP